MAQSVSASGSRTGRAVRTAYQDAEGAVRDTVNEMEDALLTFVRKHPLHVLGTVFAFGFLYALIRR